ncbi:MAG: hypothetical protein HY298_12775 [Verrucomicrobia bacterium]|nr:hypothetical protein [Verrucomicrobiota bacterium]
MEKPHKPDTVLDESGNPISKPADTVDDLNLPPGTQALIETRLNGALDMLRNDAQTHRESLAKSNESKLEELAKKKWKPLATVGWTIAAIQFVAMLIGLFKGSGIESASGMS